MMCHKTFYKICKVKYVKIKNKKQNAAIPTYVHWVAETPSLAPLCLFYGSTLFLFSFFGGGYAAMPPYEADAFGPKNVGAIHGRLMTASAIAGIYVCLSFMHAWYE